MDDMNKSAKLYFVSHFKSFIRNYNKEFSKKYSPSIRELLCDYLELHRDISSSLQNKKLENSRKAQLDVMQFYLKNTMLLKSSLIKDFESLSAKIQLVISDKNNNDISSIHFPIFQICNSLLKSLTQINIYDTISGILLNCTSFMDVDKCTELLINELIYDGYSMRFIQEWYKETAKQSNEDEFIKSLSLLKKEKVNYDIYFTVKNDCDSIPIHYINNSIKLISVNKAEIKPDISAHLSFNDTNRAYKASICSMDEYKATAEIINAFDSYFLIVNLMEDKDYKINEKISSSSNNDKINNFNIEKNDGKIILPNLDNREKNDLQDFLQYRIAVYETNIITGEVLSIERSLNILKNNNYENDETRLINLWNVLEYILSYCSGESIISKVRFIIPKLMCLYYLKDKLNVFWNTLNVSRGYGEEVKEFIENSKIQINSDKYDVSKLLHNIPEYGVPLCDKFGTNKQVISRKYMEIGSIISNKTDLKTEIETLHQKIEYDIVRIYRTRNILVHSGNLTKTNIMLKNARLMQYISNLMGVILHYKMKNNNHSISEILYSIPETYTNYLKNCEPIENKFTVPIEEVFKPKYLFL